MSGNPIADLLREGIDLDSEPYPEAWMPSVGGELGGIFEGFRNGTTCRNETHPFAVVRDDVGERFAAWLFYTVLRSAFERVDPRPGETILIRRLPDRENSKGRAYRDYKLRVYREEGTDIFASTPPLIPPQSDWTFLGDQMQ